MSRVELTAKYAAFAAFATCINLATQWASFSLYRGAGELLIGMAAGTLTGLVSKYLLDKFWIFGDLSLDAAGNLHKFSLYSLTGVVTTLLFWASELAFSILSEHEIMRYVGAVFGLSLGYMIKFQLDSRFVFQGRL